MEKTLQEALVAGAVAWGGRRPLPSAKHEWDPGCVHHGRSWLPGKDVWSFISHQTTWLRLKPFAPDGSSTQTDDLVDVYHKRAFVDLVSLISSCARFGWRGNVALWQEIVALYDNSVLPNQFPSNPRPKLRVERRRCVENLYDDHSDPRFMIDFQGVQCDLPKLEWCFSFLTALTTRVLASELQAHFTTDSNRQTPRWIAVGLDLSHCELTTSQFVKLHEVMRAYAEFEPPQAESSGCQQVFFVITSLNLSWNEFQSHRVYEIVTDIMLLQSSRVAVRHLNLTNTFYAKTPIAHVTAFQWFIQRVLRDDASSLEELSLGGECHVSDAHVAAVYSALRYSTKLKALRIKQNPESTSKEDVSCNFQAMWSWLALAVMHSSSVSTLMSLAFPYFAITEEVVDCFQKTLESEQPAMIALTAESPEMEAIVKRDSEARIHPAGKTFVSIKRGSKLRLWPKTQASVLMLSQYAIDRPLEVVLTLSKWTCVIIPGCGFGWVMNAALVVHEERQMSSRRIPLRAFMWIAPKTYTVAHIPAVRSLVCLIGEGLKALYLAKTQFTTDDMATIVAHCPLLQHLEVPRHNLLSLEFLRKHSSIRLRTLNVQFFVNGPAIDAYSPWPLVADLVAFLKSPASQRLWHLAFEYKWDGMMVTRLLTAVEKHPTLETVDIFHVSNENGDVYERQATSPGQSPAMRQAVKLAFLSVIRHQLETTSIALHRLDAVLVAAIFLFAAEPTQKQINHIHRRAYTRGF